MKAQHKYTDSEVQLETLCKEKYKGRGVGGGTDLSTGKRDQQFMFDKESNVVLCRDIDSLPNIDEIRATYYFLENKEFYLQTLRTHRNHVIPHTIILAGLCGFRPKDTYFLNDITFEMYYNSFKNNPWGVDQSSLINVFIRDREWLKNRFLDCPITTDHHYVGPPLVECRSIQKTSYLEEKDFSYIDSEIINLLEQETTWAGEPTNFRGEKLIKLLSIDNTYTNIMRNILETSSEEIKKFYLNV
jgi:hypothetical protein